MFASVGRTTPVIEPEARRGGCRREFISLVAGAGVAFLAGCGADGADSPVALVAHNESSNTHQLEVRVFRPAGELVDRYDLGVLQPGDSTVGSRRITGEIGTVVATGTTKTSFRSLPDARTSYDPDRECQSGRPDLTITIGDDGMRFSSAC